MSGKPPWTKATSVAVRSLTFSLPWNIHCSSLWLVLLLKSRNLRGNDNLSLYVSESKPMFACCHNSKKSTKKRTLVTRTNSWTVKVYFKFCSVVLLGEIALSMRSWRKLSYGLAFKIYILSIILANLAAASQTLVLWCPHTFPWRPTKCTYVILDSFADFGLSSLSLPHPCASATFTLLAGVLENKLNLCACHTHQIFLLQLWCDHKLRDWSIKKIFKNHLNLCDFINFKFGHTSELSNSPWIWMFFKLIFLMRHGTCTVLQWKLRSF